MKNLLSFYSNKFIFLTLIILSNQNPLFAAAATVNSTGNAPAANPAIAPFTATPGEITLRSAIQFINAQAQLANTISFNIAGAGPFRIQPNPALDAIEQSVFINGYSQPGSIPNTDPLVSNAVPLIEINGSNYTVGTGQFSDPSSNGLYFVGNATGSVITGLIINEWIGAGILIDGTAEGANVDGCSIIGNFIGTNAAGTAQLANQAGVFINGANNTVIGEAIPSSRNVFAGSFCSINAGASISAFFGNGTSIKGNLIGLDKTGTIGLGNSQIGIQVAASFLLFFGEADGTIIGGTTDAERNVIAGQQVADIVLGGQSSNSVVQGNFLGTDATGTKIIGLSNLGVSLNGVTLGLPTAFNLVGGSMPNAANLVVGSNVAGISVGNVNNTLTNNNFVIGNLIGTTLDGQSVLGNNGFGVLVGDLNNAVGGFLPGEGNTVSGNKNGGILIYSQNAFGTLILGNKIGTDISGVAGLGNGGAGVQIGLNGGLGGSSNNVIGA